MTINERDVAATPEKVWDVLADGWLYPLFVVGASRMREVDDTWPHAGSRLHHSVGVWPMLLDDTTEVLECAPGRMLRLRAAAWPGGAAEVTIAVEPHADGSHVVIEEDAVSGPGTLVPRPARSALLRWRNTETLRRLALLAENR